MVVPMPFKSVMVTLPLSLWIWCQQSFSSKGIFGPGCQCFKLPSRKRVILMDIFFLLLQELAWAIFIFANALTHPDFYSVCSFILHPNLLYIVYSTYVRYLAFVVFVTPQPDFTQLQFFISFTTGDLYIVPEFRTRLYSMVHFCNLTC